MGPAESSIRQSDEVVETAAIAGAASDLRIEQQRDDEALVVIIDHFIAVSADAGSGAVVPDCQ